MMKNTLVFALIIMLFVQCSNIQNGTIYIHEKNYVKLSVTSNSTKAEIDSIAQSLYEDYGIEIDYSKSIFSFNGKLRKIDLKINCNDGHSGSVRGNFYMPWLKPHGFERNYTKGSKSYSFRCGTFK